MINIHLSSLFFNVGTYYHELFCEDCFNCVSQILLYMFFFLFNSRIFYYFILDLLNKPIII